MTKFGLNGFLERTKGASLRYKLREFWWQLRYAWQRAWRGYDFTDVFELGYNFTAKMPVLLAEFLKNNVGLFYDTEADKQLDEEETNLRTVMKTMCINDCTRIATMKMASTTRKNGSRFV